MEKTIYGIERSELIEYNMFDMEWDSSLERTFYETYELAEKKLLSDGFIKDPDDSKEYVKSYENKAKIVRLTLKMEDK